MDWNSFGFWESLSELERGSALIFFAALIIAFGFEFINGFHDTANAVATSIYTNAMRPRTAVIYSGILNALGVILGGTGVAFGIINLLPVDILANPKSNGALIMIFSLLIAGVTWNLFTWWRGLPVSSSHTLIGSILGVGLAHCLIASNDIKTIKWAKIGETGAALLISPIIGFIAALILLLVAKRFIKDKALYKSPLPNSKPPRWIRWTLIGTCGGVSFAHGSNDGQKGMGLLLLVLVGFLPFHYSLNIYDKHIVNDMRQSLADVRPHIEATNKLELIEQFKKLSETLNSIKTFNEIPNEKRWEVRVWIFNINQALKTSKATDQLKSRYTRSIEFMPSWVVIGTALALGIGTMVGYKRIVVTVAEKIGKQHLTYGQGAVAESVTAVTIMIATATHSPVSTTQILSSGVAGTMVANESGVCDATVKKILIAWLFTLPVTMFMSGSLFLLGTWIFK